MNGTSFIHVLLLTTTNNYQHIVTLKKEVDSDIKFLKSLNVKHIDNLKILWDEIDLYNNQIVVNTEQSKFVQKDYYTIKSRELFNTEYNKKNENETIIKYNNKLNDLKKIGWDEI
jgi:hypothetical protein